LSWQDQTLDELASLPAIGYLAGGAAAAEPAALAALAFVAHDRIDAAAKAADALAAMQQNNGEVGVRSGETPGWPTSLAICAWCAVDRNALRNRIDRAVAWLLDNNNRGQAIPRSDNFAHNTELVGWAYAEQTHSWAEPTAFAVLALKAAGKSDDPATREGVAVLIDRLLPGGGLNYGNTYVLGQLLRPHVQPTGIALLALAQHRSPHAPREASISQSEMPTMEMPIMKSITWLRRSIGPATTPMSLGWAMLGLRASGIKLPEADEWLAAAAAHVQTHDRSPHKLALLTLAAKGWPA
jgi:hypothetical protein